MTVAVDTKVSVQFSELMASVTVNKDTVKLVKLLTNAQEETVDATVNYYPAWPGVVLVPSKPLDQATTYKAIVKGGDRGVKDLAGNPLGELPPGQEDFSWTFRTG